VAQGTKNDPWILKTPPGTSEYMMYRDHADPPTLVCQVGSTKLTYRAEAVDDLAAWLREQGDWVPLGSALTHDARNNRMRASQGEHHA